MKHADTLNADDPRAVERAADVVRSGGVLVIPTETFYGLAADFRRARAVARIFEIKGRPSGMALPLIAASLDQVVALIGPLDAASRRAAERFWPGPLSLILAAPDGAAAHDGTIAVRVPGDDFARRLCERAGTLLTATSANRTGAPPAETAAGAMAQLGGAVVDLVIDGGRAPGGRPSTIVDLRDEPRLIRDGAIAWQDVRAAAVDIER